MEVRTYDVGAAYLEVPIDTITFVKLPPSQQLEQDHSQPPHRLQLYPLHRGPMYLSPFHSRYQRHYLHRPLR